MHRTSTVLGLTALLLAPGSAWGQTTPTPSSSASGNGGPDYCRDPSTGQPYQRGPVEVFHSNDDITAGDPFTYTVEIPGPFNRVHANIRAYQWVTPVQQGDVDGFQTQTGNGSGPFGPGEAATRTVTLRPTNNAKITWGGALYCGPTGFHGDVFSSNPVIVNVAPRLTLGAVRLAPRTYVFSGTATTPGQVLDLYRVNADGSEVLTSQTRATDERRWSITRTFLGSGRFGFQARTGRTMANAPGASNIRPTVLH